MPALLKELHDGFSSIFGNGRGTAETAGQIIKRERRIESNDDLITRMWTADEELLQLGLDSLYSRDFSDGEREELREALTRRLLTFTASEAVREQPYWTAASCLGIAVSNIDQIALRENFWNWPHDSPRSVQTALDIVDASWQLMMVETLGAGLLRSRENYWEHTFEERYPALCKQYGSKTSPLGKKKISTTMNMNGIQGPLTTWLETISPSTSHEFPYAYMEEALRLSKAGQSTWKAPAVFGG